METLDSVPLVLEAKLTSDVDEHELPPVAEEV
jgi:hypothetical protein